MMLTLLDILCHISSPWIVSVGPIGRGPAQTLLKVTTSLSLEEVTVHCNKLIVVAVSRLRDLVDCEVLLTALLEIVTPFKDKRLAVTQTSWNDCVGLG